MIVFPLKKSYPHLQLEALVTRVSPTHPSYETIVSDLDIRKIGYYGEERASYFFTLLPSETCRIFHGLRLNVDNLYFQMDVLVLTSHFILLIEVKNSTQTIHYDAEIQQFYRYHPDGRKIGIKNSLEQVQNQSYLLRRWLKKKGIGDIPIDYFSVRSNHKSVVEFDGSAPHVSSRMISAEGIPFAFLKQQSIHKQEVLERKQLKKISQMLVKEHKDLVLDLFKLYDLKQEDIMCGVLCEECKALAMKKVWGSWTCDNCGHIDKDAGRRTVDQWFLVMNQPITVRKCQHFLQIDSRDYCKRLLGSMELDTIGHFKSTSYIKHK